MARLWYTVVLFASLLLLLVFWSLHSASKTRTKFRSSAKVDASVDYLKSFYWEAKLLNPTFSDKDTDASRICSTILSSNRRIPYVFRTLASLLYSSSQPDSPWIYATVVEVNDALITVFKPKHANLSVIQTGTRKSTSQTNKHEWFTQQRKDYAIALRACTYNKACKHCLILENDALLATNAIATTRDALIRLSKEPKWGLLRLFGTDAFSGWERNTNDYATLALFGALGAVVGLYLFPNYKRRWFILVYFSFGVVTPLLLGKQRTPFFGRGVGRGLVLANERKAVSSVAHVYPRHVALLLIDELQSSTAVLKHEPIDLVVGDVLSDAGLDFWEIVPNVVQHIGDVSSYDGQSDRPLIESSTYIEDSSPM